MKNYKVELLPEANRDLDEVFDYILLDNPAAAYKMVDNIFSHLEQLQDFPKLGVKLDNKIIKQYQFRMLIIEHYVAFYRIIDDEIYVYRILHGARDYLQILRGNI